MAALIFFFLADSTNVQIPVQHCCIRVCSDIVEVVTTLMGCPRARWRSECDDIYAGRAKVVWSHSAT